MHQVRQASADDVETIARFNQAMALETENLRLSLPTLVAGARNVVDDRSRGQYFVVDGPDSLAASLLITYEWSDWRNTWCWWIQSVYVSADMRRQGVFSALYAHVTAEAKRAGACGLRLYMERANERARATYHQLGMVETHYAFFEAMFE